MEPTRANQAQRDDRAPSVAGTLGQLVRAGRAASTPIPVAIVVSVFDDLLAADVDPPGKRAPDLDDVLIDQAGVARLDIAADLPAIGRLLVEALDGEVPAAGQWLVDRLDGQKSDEQPTDAAQMRGWLRESLGQPAPRAEIVDLVASVAAPLPVPEPVEIDEAPAAASTEAQAARDDADTPPFTPTPGNEASAADASDDAAAPSAPSDETVMSPSITTGDETVMSPSITTGDETVMSPSITTGDERVMSPSNTTGDERVMSPSITTGDETVTSPSNTTDDETPSSPFEDDAAPQRDASEAPARASPLAADDDATPQRDASDTAEAPSAAEGLTAGAARASAAQTFDEADTADLAGEGRDEDDDDDVHDLDTIPPNGALMAPLIGLGPSMQADIPTDPIRKRTFPVGPLPDVTTIEAPPTHEDRAPAEVDTAPEDPADEAPRADAGAALPRDEDDDVFEGDADATTLTVRQEDIAKAKKALAREAEARDRAIAAESPSKRTELPPMPPAPSKLSDIQSSPRNAPLSAPPLASSRPPRRSGVGGRATDPDASSSSHPTIAVQPPDTKRPESGRSRPVVRHQLRRDRKISVPVAPATRRTARQARGNDSIMGPSDRGFPWGWMVVLGMIAAAAYYLLFA